MPHLQTFPPTQNTKQSSTCATCPFFSDFNGRERGLCQVFDLVTKKPNLRTNDCDRSIESLLKQPKTTLVIAELITKAVEDDGFGYPVPVNSRSEQIKVAQPLKGLIQLEIAHREELQGYEVAHFTVPDGGYEV